MILTLLKIQGHSMEPAIKQGNIVLVSSLPFLFSEPKVGDVVTFRKDELIFIKRIVKIKNNQYFLKGDNSKDSLRVSWISKKDLVGKLLFIL